MSRGLPGLERTAAGLLSFVHDSFGAEESASLPGLLQAGDPRAKLSAFIVMLSAVLLSRRLEVVAGLYALALALAAGSRLPLGLFLKRTWVFVPVFAGVVVLPALFSPVSPGPSALVLWPSHEGGAFAITWPGLWTAALLVARVATSVSLGLLLVMTTRWSQLLAALRVLGVPRIFVMTLQMTYRYIFLFIETVRTEHLARASRTIRPVSARAGRQWTASRIGHLILRSRRMSEEVFLAMLSRGYDGEARANSAFRLRAGDIAGLCAAAGLLLLVLRLNGSA